METLSPIWMVEIIKAFGFAGLVAAMWYIDSRAFRKVLAQYKSDMDEQRAMYLSNVKLVESYLGLARDLKDIIIMNTQAMQRINDSVNSNQYCPHVRLEKQAKGKQG